jgi:hypothetical protein
MVIVVGLEILTVVCLGAFVNLAFLCPQNKQMMREWVEVEACSPCKPCEGGIFVIPLLLPAASCA